MPAYNECSIYENACRERTCKHPTNPNNAQKNGPNTCQSAGPHGIGKYDCSCPLVVPGGVQCRTMLSQRPCGARDCTREECSRARVSASVLATIPDTENDVTGSESAPQTTGDSEPLYTLHSLTGRDVERLEQALRMLRRIYTRDSEPYRAVSELGARVSALNWTE